MVRINLLPVKVSKKKEAGRQQLVLFALVLVLGVILNVLWARSRDGALEAKRAQIQRTRDEITKLNAVIGEVQTIEEDQKKLREKLEVLAKLQAGRAGPVRMLDELATISPKRLWLKSMKEGKGGATTFEGTAATIDDVSVFLTALKGSRYFSQVELQRTTAVDSKELRLVDFTITATALYSPGAQAPGAKDGTATPPARGG
jgi:type IV pilus assembly protein PilN